MEKMKRVKNRIIAFWSSAFYRVFTCYIAAVVTAILLLLIYPPTHGNENCGHGEFSSVTPVRALGASFNAKS